MALTEAGQRVLSYAEEIFSLGQELLDAALQQPTARSLRVHIRITDSPAVMKVAAVDGLGVFAVPTLVVKEAVARYGFQIIGRTEECRQQFYAISAERKLTHPAVVAITSQARAAFSD